MPPGLNETIIITGLTNQEFLERYAKAGCIGLTGGDTPVDLAIRRAQRHLNQAKQWGTWSHSFLFEGQRADGYQWVIESDLQFHRKHIQLGAQENRISKYFDNKLYSSMAVIDFGLDEEQIADVVRAGLDLVANHERYSIRELFGTLVAMRRPDWRASQNRLARERSVFCSAFVRRLFRKIRLDLAPGVDDKHTTPEDLARTKIPHTTYVLQREDLRSRLKTVRTKVRDRVRSKLKKLRGRK